MQGQCLKCKKQDVAVVQARKDLYCHDCFVIFTKSKYRRAVDAFRLNLPSGEKGVKMLLALSGDISSSVLVDLVYTSTKRTRGRYEMPIICYIDEAGYCDADVLQSRRTMLQHLKKNYTDLEIIERAMDEVDHYTAASIHLGPTSDLRTADLGLDARTPLKECIRNLSSKTSQEDVFALYRERLLLETAKENNCTAIMFGNSATSLAAKTLALTAKGRGYALPWETADHALSHTGIWTVRPMKGLMHNEIRMYAEMIDLPYAVRDSTVAASKATSIDELTVRYFQALEEPFPSLVATVVRTTNKLVEPVPREQALGQCKICGMTFREGAKAWLRDITVDEAAPLGGDAQHPLVSPAAADSVESLCYGCVVALRGLKADLAWPTFGSGQGPVPSGRNHDKKQLLQEFELED